VTAGNVGIRANVLSLASGGGGLDRGIRLALPDARTVCYVEIEAAAIAVLVKQMQEGGLDEAPVWTDVTSFDSGPWRGHVDWIVGGYPCQPFSVAGRRLGHRDPRNLWPAFTDIIRTIQPRGCFFENVGQHLRDGYFDVVRPDLEGLGYRVEETLNTAAEIGAPHRRERLFILALRMDDAERTVAARFGQHGRGGREEAGGNRRSGGDVVHPDGEGFEGRIQPDVGERYQRPTWPPSPTDDSGWAAISRGGESGLEPALRRMADGMAHRYDRLRILGNAVVPPQAAHAFGVLMDRHLQNGGA